MSHQNHNARLSEQLEETSVAKKTAAAGSNNALKAVDQRDQQSATRTPGKRLLLARLAVEAGIASREIPFKTSGDSIRIGAGVPRVTITVSGLAEDRYAADIRVELGRVLFVAEAQAWLAERGADDADGSLRVDDEGETVMVRRVEFANRTEAFGVVGILNEMCDVVDRVKAVLEEEFYLQRVAVTSGGRD